MDYAQLVADKSNRSSIKGWLNWDIAPSADILAEAEAFIYSQLRVREMKKLLQGVQIASGSKSYALPSDFIASISFRRIGQYAGRIDIFDSDHMESRNIIDANGDFISAVPMCCQIIEDPPVAYFDCKALADIPLRLVYWRRLPALSVSNTTNFLTNRYPLLLRAACLAQGFAFKKEANLASENRQMAADLIFSANAEYDLGEQANRQEMFSSNDD